MSDVATKTTFKVLPNEVLLLCFEYLNAPHLFYAFDYLNSRLDKLIRNIPLRLNLEFLKESVLEDFCQKMIANPQIKDQVIAMTLSNLVLYEPASALLSQFSLKKFTNLRSLKLVHLGILDLEKVLSILPRLSKLCCFDWNDRNYYTGIGNEKLIRLPVSPIRTLSVPRIGKYLPLTNKYESITRLTVGFCTMIELCELFEYTPRLKYLTCNVGDSFSADRTSHVYSSARNLEYITIPYFNHTFDDLELLFKYMRNLRSLVIEQAHDSELMDAGRWQHLITSALPLLNIFKFNFCMNCYGYEELTDPEENEVLQWFEKFQNDFWHQQHHWYTECSINSGEAHIYTIPYLSKHFELKSPTKRYCHSSTNNANTFDNVIRLTVSDLFMDEACDLHFSNVKSLKLCCSNDDNVDMGNSLSLKRIDLLETIVNMKNLIQLDIEEWSSMELSFILKLLKKMPSLSSLTIKKHHLFSLMDDTEICNYLKRIEKLNAGCYSDEAIGNSCMMRLCQVFSNMKQLKCCLDNMTTLFTALRELSNLPEMKLFGYRVVSRKFYADLWLHCPSVAEHWSFVQVPHDSFRSEYDFHD